MIAHTTMPPAERRWLRELVAAARWQRRLRRHFALLQAGAAACVASNRPLRWPADCVQSASDLAIKAGIGLHVFLPDPAVISGWQSEQHRTEAARRLAMQLAEGALARVVGVAWPRPQRLAAIATEAAQDFVADQLLQSLAGQQLDVGKQRFAAAVHDWLRYEEKRAFRQLQEHSVGHTSSHERIDCPPRRAARTAGPPAAACARAAS